jgi:hypothetical protein
MMDNTYYFSILIKNYSEFVIVTIPWFAKIPKTVKALSKQS